MSDLKEDGLWTLYCAHCGMKFQHKNLLAFIWIIFRSVRGRHICAKGGTNV